MRCENSGVELFVLFTSLLVRCVYIVGTSRVMAFVYELLCVHESILECARYGEIDGLFLVHCAESEFSKRRSWTGWAEFPLFLSYFFPQVEYFSTTMTEPTMKVLRSHIWIQMYRSKHGAELYQNALVSAL